MQKTIKYTIFKTKWGYFGLAATDNGLLRTYLPLANREKVKSQLLQNFPDSQYENGLFGKVQKQITAYFEGDCVDFKDVPVAHCHSRESGNPDGVRIDFRSVPVVLNGLSAFTKRVLTTCRDIDFGQTVSYGRLAEMAGKPGSARAVGGALARNPLSLIIPCHRVIRIDGSLGGFSTPGGLNLKKRMLKLEASYRAATVMER